MLSSALVGLAVGAVGPVGAELLQQFQLVVPSNSLPLSALHLIDSFTPR